MLFFLAIGAGWFLPGRPPEWVGGLASAGGLLALLATLACGLAGLEPPRPGGWSVARGAGVFLALALVGLATSAGLAWAGDLLLVASRTAAFAQPLGRVASWFLAMPLGLAVGALLGRLRRRDAGSAFLLGATLFAVLAAWGLHEFRPAALPEASRYSFCGPGPALTVADDRLAHWLANSSAEARRFAVGGTFWLKWLFLIVALALGGLATQLRGRAHGTHE